MRRKMFFKKVTAAVLAAAMLLSSGSTYAAESATTEMATEAVTEALTEAAANLPEASSETGTSEEETSESITEAWTEPSTEEATEATETTETAKATEATETTEATEATEGTEAAEAEEEGVAELTAKGNVANVSVSLADGTEFPEGTQLRVLSVAEYAAEQLGSSASSSEIESSAKAYGESFSAAWTEELRKSYPDATEEELQEMMDNASILPVYIKVVDEEGNELSASNAVVKITALDDMFLSAASGNEDSVRAGYHVSTDSYRLSAKASEKGVAAGTANGKAVMTAKLASPGFGWYSLFYTEQQDGLDVTSEPSECTCGIASIDPWDHGWDCPVFQAVFAKTCTCDVESDFPFAHDIDCEGMLKAMGEVCTCDGGAQPYILHEEDCEVITRMREILCDCGTESNNPDDHEADCAYVMFLMESDEVSMTELASLGGNPAPASVTRSGNVLNNGFTALKSKTLSGKYNSIRYRSGTSSLTVLGSAKSNEIKKITSGSKTIWQPLTSSDKLSNGKASYGARYSKVVFNKYDGKWYDLLISVVDYTDSGTFKDGEKAGVFPGIGFHSGEIGFYFTRAGWYVVQCQFVKTGTSTPAKLKVRLNFTDLDDYQVMGFKTIGGSIDGRYADPTSTVTLTNTSSMALTSGLQVLAGQDTETDRAALSDVIYDVDATGFYLGLGYGDNNAVNFPQDKYNSLLAGTVSMGAELVLVANPRIITMDYTISYHLASGSLKPTGYELPDSVTKTAGSTYTVEKIQNNSNYNVWSADMYKAGYTVYGWNYSSDMSGEYTKEGDTIYVDSDYDYYIKYVRARYFVEYKYADGSAKPAGVTLPSKATVEATPNVNTTYPSVSYTVEKVSAATGYTVTGWYTNADKSGSMQAGGKTITINSDKVFYVYYEPKVNEIPSPVKSVSNTQSGVYGVSNQLSSTIGEFYYKIEQEVPSQVTSDYNVSSMVITDTLPAGVDFVSWVSTPSQFSCTNSGKTLTMTASNASADSFQGNTYTFIAKVKMDPTEITPTQSGGKDVYTVKNTASTKYKQKNDSSYTTKSSNTVTTTAISGAQEVPSPVKYVAATNSSSSYTTGTASLSTHNSVFYYKIVQEVPEQESSNYNVESMTITDTLPTGVKFLGWENMPSEFTCTNSGQTLTMKAVNPSLDSFQGKTYTFIVRVQMVGSNITPTEISGSLYYIVNNTATLNYKLKSDTSSKTKNSNKVIAQAVMTPKTPNAPTKYVATTQSGSYGTSKELSSPNSEFYYKIEQEVPTQVSSDYNVTSMVITDTLPTGVEFISWASTPSQFSCTNSGQTLTMTANNASADSFQGKTYTFIVKVKMVKDDITATKSGDYDVYTVRNTATTKFTQAHTGSTPTSKNSNTAVATATTGPHDVPAPVKQVSLKQDTDYATSVELTSARGEYYYKITQEVPAQELSDYNVTSLEITDTLPAGVDFVSWVSKPSGFTCTANGKDLTMTADNANTDSFQNKTYTFIMKVKMDPDEITPTPISGSEDQLYTVKNTATLKYQQKHESSTKTKNSGTVTTTAIKGKIVYPDPPVKHFTDDTSVTEYDMDDITGTVTFRITQTIPENEPEYMPKSITLTDKLNECLEYAGSSAYSYDKTTNTVSTTVEVQENQSQVSFFITCKIKDDANLQPYTKMVNGKPYAYIPNTASTKFVWEDGTEYEQDTKEVQVVVPVHYRNLTVTKTNKVTGENIADAEFTVYEWDGTDYTKEVGKLEYQTRYNLYRIENLFRTTENEGKFKVVETKTPTGFVGAWSEEFVISTDSNGEDMALSATNDMPKGTITITKQSKTTKESLSGAEYTVTAAEDIVSPGGKVLVDKDTEVAKVTTGSDGTVTTDGLYMGKYLVTETKAPAGYDLDADPQTVEIKYVDKDTVTKDYPITFVNDRLYADLTITKELDAEDIVWTHGNPTFTFKVDGTDATGEKHTYYETVEFTKDSVATTGKVTVSAKITVFAGKYTATEEKTMRYELSSIHSVTGGTTSGTSVTFNVSDGKDGAATFYNVKTNDEEGSHTSFVRNHIG